MRTRRNNDRMLLESLVRKYGKNGVKNAINEMSYKLIENFEMSTDELIDYLFDNDLFSDGYDDLYFQDSTEYLPYGWSNRYDAYAKRIKGNRIKIINDIEIKFPDLIAITDQRTRQYSYDDSFYIERIEAISPLVFYKDGKIIKFANLDYNKLIKIIIEDVDEFLNY